MGRTLYIDELQHYGVKGMKWGVRHDTQNSNYSSEQRARDKAVYGRGGVKRINRSMNKGLGISGARSKEASRINRHRAISRSARQVGSIIGGVGGALGGLAVSNAILKKYGGRDPMTDMAIKGVVATGSYTLGKQLGRYGGQSIGMLSGGYSPNKYR